MSWKAVFENPTKTSLRLRDRVSGNFIYLTLRDGVVVGAMGSDPARYVGLTERQARHKARFSQRGDNPIVSGYDDPFYIVHGMYEDSRITDEFGSDDEAEALAAAKKLLRSPFFEGDIVRVITRDGEFVWEQHR